MQSLPATEQRLEIHQAQDEDEICQRLKTYCEKGWPERCRVEGVLKPYLPVASELTFQDGLLVRGNRIVIPTLLRLDILERLHRVSPSVERKPVNQCGGKVWVDSWKK